MIIWIWKKWYQIKRVQMHWKARTNMQQKNDPNIKCVNPKLKQWCDVNGNMQLLHNDLCSHLVLLTGGLVILCVVSPIACTRFSIICVIEKTMFLTFSALHSTRLIKACRWNLTDLRVYLSSSKLGGAAHRKTASLSIWQIRPSNLTFQKFSLLFWFKSML